MSQVETQNWSEDHGAAELSDYRSVSRLAVFALFLGVASVSAWLGPYFWWSPVVAACVAIVSLIRVNRRGMALIGRNAAVCGLCLALINGFGAPTRYYAYRYLVQREGERFEKQWFGYLRKGEIEKAHQLSLGLAQRRSLKDDLWEFYREHKDFAEDLREYANSPVVRTLLALGNRAEVRLYDRHGVAVYPRTDAMIDEFAVTFDDQGTKKTFFLLVFLERHYNAFVGRGQWKIAKVEVRVPPELTVARKDRGGDKVVLPEQD